MLQSVELLSEPIPVPSIYVSGLACMEKTGDGNWELICYCERRSPTGGAPDYIIVSRCIVSTAAILEGVKLVLRKLGRRCCGAVLEMVH